MLPSRYDVEKRYSALLDEIARELPGFRLVRKDRSWFQRAIHRTLVVVTFGAQRRYLTSYQTTIGRTVYVTRDWDALPAAQRYITMRHEREHLRQFRRFTLPGMALLYVLLPVPVGLAWFRARFEKQGYAETIRAAAEVHGVAHVRDPQFREYVVKQFLTGAYGWMWPFRRGIERWYDGVVSTCEDRG
jgi:hypothetical protein